MDSQIGDLVIFYKLWIEILLFFFINFFNLFVHLCSNDNQYQKSNTNEYSDLCPIFLLILFKRT